MNGGSRGLNNNKTASSKARRHALDKDIIAERKNHNIKRR
jgi:hypothetical protein